MQWVLKKLKEDKQIYPETKIDNKKKINEQNTNKHTIKKQKENIGQPFEFFINFLYRNYFI